ncbi:hypothetical protein ACFQDG_09080 [Natronoarchaeum mannanilyticum]|uniref:DUF7511 domain-containing protein n=1 Tax=Natronoarchaeum mannanilyticum TaxID=926360 RepID=A0AAV3T7D4_9EURY
MATDSPLDGTGGDHKNESGAGRVPAESNGARRRIRDLRHEVVSYPDAPDRCTIFPPDATGVARMSTWLTADHDAFVDLATVR